MLKLFKCLVAVCALVVATNSALAVNPDEVLDDPALEQRARELSVQIRCLVCQNQSIDDSDAQLARDLRVLVREKLVEGLSDDQILEFLVKRYGEFVLLNPRLSPQTFLLWALPLVLLLIGGLIAFILFKRRKPVLEHSDKLSKEDQRKIDQLLS